MSVSSSAKIASELDRLFAKSRPTKWVTRERPKIDRIACPWLILRFIDPQAEFLYVPVKQVFATAQRENAVEGARSGRGRPARGRHDRHRGR